MSLLEGTVQTAGAGKSVTDENLQNIIKGTRCLGSVELVFEKHL